mmetsp:Transcript_86646/g.240246  ORF Transcript_86646/g.240246 Transcript_86646/m.240246 type:complete len:235 (-) Transcript_86646:42-746(-)
MAEQRIRWGGIGEEEANRAAKVRAEEILARLKGKREGAGYQCVLQKDLQIGGEESLKRAFEMAAERERQEADHAKRKEAKRTEAAMRRAREEADCAQKLAAEDAEARRRTSDPEYAARRMAEDEAEVLRRLVEEKDSIEAEFAAAEARVKGEESEHTRQQEAVRVSLEKLEQEKQKREEQRRIEAVRKSQEEQALQAYAQAKEALARKEKAKLKVEDVQTRGMLKMSFKKSLLL